ADLVLEASGPLGAVATFALPTATDPSDPNPVVTVSIPSGSWFPLGTTAVTVTATDRWGAVSTSTFHVSVQDTTGPVLPSLPDVIVAATDGRGARVHLDLPVATDLVDPSPVVTMSRAADSLFPM